MEVKAAVLLEGSDRGPNGNGNGKGVAKIMIVDDQALFRDALKLLLESTGEFDVVANADSVEAAARYARGHRPDIAVIGPFILEPALSGGEDRLEQVIRSIRQANEASRVLLVTANRDMRRLADGLEAGATGIVELGAPSDEFVDAVEMLANGDAHLPPGLALEMVRLGRADDEDGLTGRELDLLTEVALGYTNQEIADHLHLSVRTVESHRARIQTKLGVSSRAGLVRSALDRGLVH